MRRATKHLPWVVKASLWNALNRLGTWPQRIRRGPARGMVMFAPVHHHFGYCYGRHEPAVVDALTELVRPGMTVCDIGSHFGYFTLALARLVGPEGKVFAFEPLPQLVSMLRRSVALNDLRQVSLEAVAAGAANGTAEMEAWPNAARSRLAGALPEARRLRRHRTRVVALDSWASNRVKRLDLIKLDVEGFEGDVLTGARRLLRDCRPSVLCELHHGAGVPTRPLEVAQQLIDAGYQLKLVGYRDTGRRVLDELEQMESSLPHPDYLAVRHVLAVPGA